METNFGNNENEDTKIMWQVIGVVVVIIVLFAFGSVFLYAK
jgi:hypothetical protein